MYASKSTSVLKSSYCDYGNVNLTFYIKSYLSIHLTQLEVQQKDTSITGVCTHELTVLMMLPVS